MSSPELLPEQYNIIWSISWMSLYPTIEALLEKNMIQHYVQELFFLSSINFWKYPVKGWRKTIDIATVKVVFLYQLYKSFLLKDRKYIGFATTAISSYYIGCYFFEKKDYWAYTYFHFGLHIIANMGNLSLLRKKIL